METPTRSTRDVDDLRARLERWLTTVLPGADATEVGDVSSPSSTGMSSETLLFDASWRDAGEHRSGSFAARLAPDPADVPVFPVYDLEAQFRLLRLLAEHSRVPVPRTRWLETDARHLGTPFFVMDRVEGRVPPDILPYTMDGWVLAATPEERRRLQDASVGVLAHLHAVDVDAHDVSFLEFDVPGDTPLRRHFENQRRYYDWVRGDRRHRIIEDTFDWLEDNWPEESATVISWGDSRIGNVMYGGFEPVAVLDWEMAGLGPREIDVGWMVFMHVFFQDLTERAGMPGLPDFMRSDDARAAYEAAAGVELVEPRWYEVYAGLRHGIVMTRVTARSVHFGEAEWPDDPDATIPHCGVLEQMLAGTWWDR
jgi:aminoglycoside phosphotransferase (APT) family kinase protein